MEEKAFNQYNKFLEIIEEKLTKKATYGKQLNLFGYRYFGKNWKGVYAKNKIPKKLNINDMLIFNLDNSDEPGSHWCALYFDGKHRYIYDSFSRRVLGSGYIYSDLTDKEQKNNEYNCGQRCLAWLCVIDSLGIKYAIKI